MEQKGPIQINLEQVLRSKLGSKSRFVPRSLVRWLERTVCQEQLNEKLRLYYPLRGAEFCEAAIDDFGVTIDVANAHHLPAAEDKRVIYVCNHPLGGFDGVTLIAELSRRYGTGLKFIVNDILMAVEPLTDVFLPINKHGRQGRSAIQDINDAMAGPEPIVIFPAGLVSRMGSNGEICDLKWNKMFVAKAIQHQRDVVPLFFSGENSRKFYRTAQWRKRLGLKFNIEMIYLPREALACQGKHFTITAGPAISWQQLSSWDRDYLATAQRVKDIVYSLKA